MKKIIKYFSLGFTFLIVSGCAQTTETTQALAKSKLPWARPTDWEKNMPLTPGIQY